MTSPPTWPTRLAGIGYGADYYPEQWPAHTRREDLRLMTQAGVSIVSLAVFAWSSLEPREGEYQWEWLDETMDALAEAGIRVALGTATASPPPWLSHRHPEILPQDREGGTFWPGGRQAYSVTHPIWRRYALNMAERIAERYAPHPALAVWHLDNELAAHVTRDYSDAAAEAFRRWLEKRYLTIDQLNTAWHTSFWSQRYDSFAEILPPRRAPTASNPTQELDFRRFSSDIWREWCIELGTAVRRFAPEIPVTSNVITMTGSDALNLFQWRDAVDVIAVDHYTHGKDPERHVELALAADLARGLASGRPYLLAEHATSAVNWQSVNRAKGPGEMFRNTFSHIARGADAAMFFQWRQSIGGAERFHSAMVPHAGENSRLWRRSVALGQALGRIGEVRGTRVRAGVVIVFDYEAWWACELPSNPSEHIRYIDNVRAFFSALFAQNVPVDIRHPSDDLEAYRVVLVPTLTLSEPAFAERLAALAQNGAEVVVTFFSGIMDANAHIVPGGYPGLFRELLGVRSDEFAPVPPEEQLELDNGMRGSLWAEPVQAPAELVRARFASGPAAGSAAITRRSLGAGGAWYLATRLAEQDLERFTAEILRTAGMPAGIAAPRGVEIMTRSADDADFAFVINHTAEDATVPLSGVDLLTGDPHLPDTKVSAGRVSVLRIRPTHKPEEAP